MTKIPEHTDFVYQSNIDELRILISQVSFFKLQIVMINPKTAIGRRLTQKLHDFKIKI